MGRIKEKAQQCGGACLARADCFSFTWTAFEDGTCWFKNGGDAHSVAWVFPFTLCGKVTRKQTTQTSPLSNVTPTLAPIAGYCRADVIPLNGDAYFESNPNQIVVYGEILNDFVSIIYKCIENYQIIGNGTNICINGRWQWPKPECLPRCSPTEIQGVTVSANCFSIRNNIQESTSCIRPVEPGTIAYISCQRGYEKTGPQQTLTCGANGRWQPSPQRCTQICGEINEGAAYVVGGVTTNITRVPWHVGIYKRNDRDTKFQQICGGTIISSRVIISAMVKIPTLHFVDRS